MYWIVLILSLVVVIWAIRGRIVRSRRYRLLAVTLGLKYLGSKLPPTLFIRDASFWDSLDLVSNAMTGNFQDIQMVIFDHHANHGDLSYKQTIAAWNSPKHIGVLNGELGVFGRNSGICSERIGEWLLMYRPKEEVSPEDAVDFLKDCSSMLAAFGTP